MIEGPNFKPVVMAMYAIIGVTVGTVWLAYLLGRHSQVFILIWYTLSISLFPTSLSVLHKRLARARLAGHGPTRMFTNVLYTMLGVILTSIAILVSENIATWSKVLYLSVLIASVILSAFMLMLYSKQQQ